MSNTVQEKVKTDWEKAQKEGGQRFDRIREIVKAAATEAFSELKEGSTEIESLSRQSLAEMIAQLKAKEAAEAAAADRKTIVVEQVVDTEGTEFADQATVETPSPTWPEILAEIFNLANDRKADWAQQIVTRLQVQMDKFDADMATEYGTRYSPLRPVVRGLRGLLDLAQSRLAKPSPSAPTEPIQIVVVDEGETVE